MSAERQHVDQFYGLATAVARRHWRSCYRGRYDLADFIDELSRIGRRLGLTRTERLICALRYGEGMTQTETGIRRRIQKARRNAD